MLQLWWLFINFNIFATFTAYFETKKDISYNFKCATLIYALRANYILKIIP